MLFLHKDDEYVEILRKNYASDMSYYMAIMKLKVRTQPLSTP